MRVPFHAGQILGVGACLLPPISAYAFRGVAPLFAVTAVLMLATWIDRRPTFTGIDRKMLLAVFALPAWAVLSAIWSLTPLASFVTAVSLLVTMIGGAVLIVSAVSMTNDERDVFERMLLWGGLVGLIWLGSDLYGGAVVYDVFLQAKGKPALDASEAAGRHFGPAGAVGACFAWIWCGVIWRRFGVLAAVAGLCFAGAVITGIAADTPKAGLLAGSVVAVVVVGFARMARRATCVGVTIVVVGYVVAFPAIISQTPHVYDIIEALPDLPQQYHLTAASLYHRITIWQTAVMHTMESPIIGLGFDTSRALYDSGDQVAYQFVNQDGVTLMASQFEPIPLHPHNGVIQVWLELGAVGALLFAVLSGFVVRAIFKMPGVWRDDVCRVATLLVGLSILSISFGLWQSWWLSTLLLTAAFMAGCARPETARLEPVNPST